MKVIWQPAARRDRAEIFEYISAYNPSAAARMDLLFSRAAERLGNFPESGKPGAILGTRELVPHRNYRLVYQVTRGAVRILGLLHVAQQWPPATPEDA